MNIDPWHLLIGMWVLVLAMFPIAYVYPRWREARLRHARAQFTQQVGGLQHYGDGGTRPRFGYFPDQDHYTPPFYWAIEFSRSGHYVLTFESRTVTKTVSGGKTRHKTWYWPFVEVMIPHCPCVRIGPANTFITDRTLKAQMISGTPADEFGLYVSSPDEAFARTLVTRRLATAIAGRAENGRTPTVVFQEGTIRTTPFSPTRLDGQTAREVPSPAFTPKKRFNGRNVLGTADFLIEIVRSIPPRTWRREVPP